MSVGYGGSGNRVQSEDPGCHDRLTPQDNTGATLATAPPGNRWHWPPARPPESIRWSPTPTTGAGPAILTATYPHRQTIGYDANDHATSVDDGTRITAETLDPAGRVLRRIVTDETGTILEDTSYGYDDAGDSPAYTIPTNQIAVDGTPNSTAVTSVITGSGGLTGSWPIANNHGDTVGTADFNGTWTPNPVADEYGNSTTQPGSRLGWLGQNQRYSITNTGIIRMGVRLYDLALGRFLQVDPIEGGSANNYDYVGGDPVNELDLDGCNVCSNRTFRTVVGVASDGDYVRAGYYIVVKHNLKKALRLRDPSLLEYRGSSFLGRFARRFGRLAGRIVSNRLTLITIAGTSVDAYCSYWRDSQPNRAPRRIAAGQESYRRVNYV